MFNFSKNEKNPEEENKVTLIEFETHKCTYLYFGNIDINQSEYECNTCFPGKGLKLCKDCYYNCHKDCERVEDSESPENPKIAKKKSTESNFICYCGKVTKHKIGQATEAQELVKCNTVNLNKYLQQDIMYRISQDGNTLLVCPVCAFKCNGYNFERELVQCDGTFSTECQCDRNDRHSDNIGLFEARETYLTDCYPEKKAINDFQILNCLFDIKCFDNFIESFQDLYNPIYINDEKLFNLTQLFQNFQYTFKKFNKDSFYFHPKLVNLFNYEFMKKIIINAAKKGFKNVLYEYGYRYFPTFIYYLHLKQDFKNLKLFTSNDILTCSLEERLVNYKQLQRVIETDERINDKYFKNDDSSLKELIFSLFENIDKSNLDNSSDNFWVILKSFYYCLKLRIFNLDDYVKLIQMLYKNHHILYEKEYEWNDAIPVKELYNKIIFTICVNYNDLISLALIEKRPTGEFKYIHYRSEQGELLLKLILKTSFKFTENFENTRDMNRKIVNLFIENLKLFILAENAYSKQLEQAEINKLYYYNYYSQESNDPESSAVYDLTKQMLAKLDKEIEGIFNLKNGNRYEAILTVLDSYIVELGGISGKERDIDDIELKRYHKKLIKYLARTGEFTRVLNLKCLMELSEALILTNADVYFSRLITLISTSEDNDCLAILDLLKKFMTVFLFNDYSLKYLLRGKTFSIILDKLNNSKYYKLLSLITKGIEIFKIDLTNSKFAQTLGVQLVTRIKQLSASPSEDKLLLIQIMKIFKSFMPYYDSTELKLIQYTIITYFKVNDLFTADIFNKIFNENILNKYKFADANRNFYEDKIKEFNDEGEKLILNNQNLINVGPNLEEEEVNNTRPQSQADTLTDKKLLFAFFDLIQFDYMYEIESYYINLFSHVRNTIDINLIENVFNVNYLSLKDRSRMLVFITRTYFLDIFHPFGTLYLLSNTDYDNCIKNVDPYKTTWDDIGITKYNIVQANIKIMNILSNEFRLMKLLILNQSVNEVMLIGYVKGILKVTRYVLDCIFYNKISFTVSFTEHLLVSFYKLSLYLAKAYNTIMAVLLNKDKDIYYIKTKLNEELNLDNKFVSAFDDIEDFFEYDKVYEIVLNMYAEFAKQIDIANYNDNTLLFKDYDRQCQKEYFTVGIKLKLENEHFYSNLPKEKASTKFFQSYSDQFFDFLNTNIYTISSIWSDEDKITIREIIPKFYIAYLNSQLRLEENYDISIHEIINKLFYFDTEQFESYFSNVGYYSEYFTSILFMMKKSFIITKALGKNLYIRDLNKNVYLKKTTLMLNICKRLFENSNGVAYNHYDNVLKEKELSITKDLNQDDLYPYISMYAESNLDGGPYLEKEAVNYIQGNIFNEEADKGKNIITCYSYLFNELIALLDISIARRKYSNYTVSDVYVNILSANILGLLGQINSQYSDDYFKDLLTSNLEHMLTSMSKIILYEADGPLDTLQNNSILIAKQHALNFLISYLESSTFNKINELGDNMSLVELFEWIIYYCQILIKKYQERKLLSIDLKIHSQDFVSEFLNLYIFNSEFRNSHEFTFCLLAFKYIMLMKVYYKIDSIDKYYEANENYLLKQTKFDEDSFYSKSGLRVYQFFSSILVSIDVVKWGTQSYILFYKPNITFLLSEQTKKIFLDRVDRSTYASKLESLVSETDYFIFEMMYNYNMAVKNKLNKIFQKIIINRLEFLNYLMIIIHQVMFFAIFFKTIDSNAQSVDAFTFEAKLTAYSGNIILAIIQCVYVFLVIVFWFLRFMPLTYQYSIMKEFDVKFINKETKELGSVMFNFSGNIEDDNKTVFDNLNNNISFWKKALIFVTDVILQNKTINIFIFTLILTILFLITSNPMFLIVPVLFIYNLNVLLYDIVYALKLRWKSLCLVIGFTYILAYLFGWVGFLYLYKIFSVDALVPETVYK
jgi:hypothetical protein